MSSRSQINIEILHQSITKALKFGAMLQSMPRYIEELIDFRLWEHRHCRDKGRNFESLVEYLTYNEPDGCQIDIDRMTALISHDTQVLGKWRKAVTAQKHVHKDDAYNVSIIPKHGNSRAYTIARLERDYPRIAAAVHAGEMSPNAAAIQVGIRKKASPFEQVKKLLPRLSAQEKTVLCQMLK
jgi:hypothetical protein